MLVFQTHKHLHTHAVGRTLLLDRDLASSGSEQRLWLIFILHVLHTGDRAGFPFSYWQEERSSPSGWIVELLPGQRNPHPTTSSFIARGRNLLIYSLHTPTSPGPRG